MVFMADESVTLGPTLKLLRAMQEKSLKSIADLADISPAYLQKLEKGEVTAPLRTCCTDWPCLGHRLSGVDAPALCRPRVQRQ